MFMDVSLVNQKLKEKGYRTTKVRDDLLLMLAKAKRPVSAQEIIDDLSTKQATPNKSTIYRELDTLLAESIIREIDLLDGKKRYEIFVEDDHHHHILCVSCKKIAEIDMTNDLDLVIHHIQKSSGFTILHHNLEFFGLCHQCQKK